MRTNTDIPTDDKTEAPTATASGVTDITADTKTEVSTATAAAKTAQPQFRTFYCVSDQPLSFDQTRYSLVGTLHDELTGKPSRNSVLSSFPFSNVSISSSALNLDSQRKSKAYPRPWIRDPNKPTENINERPIFKLELTETDCFFLNIKFDHTDAKDEKYIVDAKLLSPISASFTSFTYYGHNGAHKQIQYSFQNRNTIEKELQQTWETALGKTYTKLRTLILKLRTKDLSEHEQKLINEIDFKLIQIGSKSNSMTQLINLFDEYRNQRERAERPWLSWIFSPSYHSIHYQAFLYVAVFNLNAILKFSEFQTELYTYIPAHELISIIEDYLFFSPASFRKDKPKNLFKQPQPPKKITQPIDEKSAPATQPTTASFCKRKFNDSSNQSEPSLKISKASDEEPEPAVALRK